MSYKDFKICPKYALSKLMEPLNHLAPCFHILKIKIVLKGI